MTADGKIRVDQLSKVSDTPTLFGWYLLIAIFPLLDGFIGRQMTPIRPERGRGLCIYGN